MRAQKTAPRLRVQNYAKFGYSAQFSSLICRPARSPNASAVPKTTMRRKCRTFPTTNKKPEQMDICSGPKTRFTLNGSDGTDLFLRVLIVTFGIVVVRTAAARTRRLTAGGTAARRTRRCDTATGRAAVGTRRFRGGRLVRFRLRTGRLVGRLFHDTKKYLVEHIRRSAFRMYRISKRSVFRIARHERYAVRTSTKDIPTNSFPEINSR